MQLAPAKRLLAPTLLLGLLLAGGLALVWLTQDAPRDPARLRGLLRVDALSALVTIVAAGHGLVGVALGEHPWRLAAAATLTACAAMSGHLAVTAALLVMASLIDIRNQFFGALLVALGLALIGLMSGEWLHGAPGAGRGLSSASVALILGGALLTVGVPAMARGRAPAAQPLATLGALYALLRLFSLGPWNLGWLFAALLAGGALTLVAAWGAARTEPSAAGPWLALWLAGLALAGAGLGSGAGVVLAGFALLLGPVLRLGLSDPAPARASWLLSAAAPLSGPFVAAWLGVAAAAAGGLTLLAVALWAAALLAAWPPARSGAAGAAPLVGGRRGLAGAMLSASLGLLSPLVVLFVLQPVAAQLQGGLTPFGAIELWPWAGLIALDAARQPVATLPSVALTGLMLVLSALCWVALRLGARRTT